MRRQGLSPRKRDGGGRGRGCAIRFGGRGGSGVGSRLVVVGALPGRGGRSLIGADRTIGAWKRSWGRRRVIGSRESVGHDILRRLILDHHIVRHCGVVLVHRIIVSRHGVHRILVDGSIHSRRGNRLHWVGVG